MWAPVSGNRVAAWLNVAGLHAVALWQLSHVVGNAEARWFGCEVASNFA
jgi:hypothetical protein